MTYHKALSAIFAMIMDGWLPAILSHQSFVNH